VQGQKKHRDIQAQAGGRAEEVEEMGKPALSLLAAAS